MRNHAQAFWFSIALVVAACPGIFLAVSTTDAHGGASGKHRIGLPDVPQHPQAILSISELGTVGVLHAMKQVHQRPFYHWLKDNYGHLFPKLPSRTRLFRRLVAQSCWTGYFLAQPSILGVADSYGIALRHPVREGRRDHQVGRKGQSNHRWVVGWIVGGRLGIVQTQWGLVTDGDCATANVHDQTFLPLLAQYDGLNTTDR